MVNFDKVGLGHSVALRALPSLRSGHLTADKREIKNFPKLPSATSFIRETLGEFHNRINPTEK